MDGLRCFNPEGSTLRLHQMRMLAILKFIDGVCRKHHISYWLSSGTLLGAVRHGGFIPWDDDLDIELLKSDYIKLMKILPQELPADLILQTVDTDNNYVAPYAKIRETNSCICETNNRGQNYKYNGIYIDIFYLEPVAPFLVKVSAKLHGYAYQLSSVKNDRLGLKLFVMHALLFILTRLIYPVFRIISRIMRIKDLRLGLGSGFMGMRKMSELFPLEEIPFEDETFWGPNDCSSYLTRLYGDYKKIPDVNNLDFHLDSINME